MPFTPGVALNVITVNIPIKIWLEDEAAEGAIRLKNLGHWEDPPFGKPSVRLISL